MQEKITVWLGDWILKYPLHFNGNTIIPWLLKNQNDMPEYKRLKYKFLLFFLHWNRFFKIKKYIQMDDLMLKIMFPFLLKCILISCIKKQNYVSTNFDLVKTLYY